METELTLSIGGFPPLSARGCEQRLTPVQTGQLRRTINGQLVHVGGNLPLKYASTISGQDKSCLATEGLYRGAIVVVGCIQRLAQKGQGPQVILERDSVPGSIVVMTGEQEIVEVASVDGRIVTFGGNRDVYVSYRPSLSMRVVQFELSTNEWGISSDWRLVLEEC